MSSDQEGIPESRKKQLNFGLVPEEDEKQIKLDAQDFIMQVRKFGFAKLSNNKFMSDMLKSFGPRIEKWLLTGLSAGEAVKEAKIAVIKKKLMKEGINKFIGDFMEKIASTIDQSFQRLLEENWDDIVAYFNKASEEDTDE